MQGSVFAVLPEKSSPGKPLAAPVVLLGTEQSSRACGFETWGLRGGAGGVPAPGPAAEADRRRDGRRRAGGRTGLARGTAARLFLVLRAHRVSSCFQAVLLLDLFGLLCHPPPPPHPPPALQMSQGGRAASVEGCLEEGSEREGYQGAKVRQVVLGGQQ